MHSPFPWKLSKDKHGLDAGRHVIAYLPNGTDDMGLVISSEKAGDPFEDAQLIMRAAAALALLED